MAEPSASSPEPETASPPLKLINLDPRLPSPLASAAWPLPAITSQHEAIFDKLDLDLITHLVLIISRDRQQQILQKVGVHHDPRHPRPFWHFLGRVATKAVWQDAEDRRLELFNFIAVRRHEVIVFETARGRAQGSDRVNALEVTFNRSRPRDPVECFWKPARKMVTRGVQKCLDNPALVDLESKGKTP